MLPGKGSLKANHKTAKVNGVSILKTAVLFGANASDKSNLMKAIDFGQKLILRGAKPEKPIDYQKFRLNKDASISDSIIEYEIQHKGKNYAYGFIFNNQVIKEEWLYETGSKKEIKIFERNVSREEIFDLDYIIQRLKKDEEKQLLRFTAKGTT